MKIGQPSENLSAAASALQKAAQAPQAVVTQAAPALAKGTGVTVSPMTKALESSALASSDGDVDTQKVDAMKAAISNGTFVADAEKIADKMLANAQEILNRIKH